MKEKILNNFGLKLLAVVFAILLWLTIINVIDPSEPKTISGIPVELLNQEALTDRGYTFQVIEGNTVAITVTGPKSKIDTLTATDFVAYADISKISELSDYVDIEVKCTKSGISQSNLTIDLRNDTVKIDIENRESRTMDVDVNIIGTPAAGYAIGEYDVSPMSIKLTGAESIIQSIARVEAEYDINGASLDVSENLELKLFDEDGNELSKDGLTLSRDTVRVKIPLLIKKVVPVNYAHSGTVREGYKIAKMTCSIESAVIAGSADAVDAISSIDLPAELINVSDIYEDATYSVRISHYIPSSVKLISDAIISEVVVDVEPLVTKKIDVPVSNITIENKNNSYKYEFAKKSISVTYTGLSADIENITATGIKASIDATGLEKGANTVKVLFENANNCTVVGEYTIDVNVSR